MKRVLLLGLLAFSVSVFSQVEERGIDIDCADWSNQLVERLGSEGLLAGESESEKARAIGLELCSNAEQVAQQQHEEEKEYISKNWFFLGEGGDKPGNERLKNLRR